MKGIHKIKSLFVPFLSSLKVTWYSDTSIFLMPLVLPLVLATYYRAVRSKGLEGRLAIALGYMRNDYKFRYCKKMDNDWKVFHVAKLPKEALWFGVPLYSEKAALLDATKGLQELPGVVIGAKFMYGKVLAVPGDSNYV
jgi:hypothetical protein